MRAASTEQGLIEVQIVIDHLTIAHLAVRDVSLCQGRVDDADKRTEFDRLLIAVGAEDEENFCGVVL